MKKLLCAMLALALMLALTPLALAEDEAPAGYDFPELTPSDLPVAMTLPGEWYADFQGLAIKLTLSGDGAYALEVPGTGKSSAGAWEIKDGMLYLEGNEAPLLPLDDALIWSAVSLTFLREQPVTYTPAEVYADAQTETFNGWWRAQFTQVGGSVGTASKRPAVRRAQGEGSVILSSAIGDDTALYMENGKAALAGRLFGRQVAEFSLKDGALTAKVEGAKVTLQLQQDGFMRLTYERGGETRVIYLMPKADLGAKAE